MLYFLTNILGYINIYNYFENNKIKIDVIILLFIPIILTDNCVNTFPLMLPKQSQAASRNMVCDVWASDIIGSNIMFQNIIPLP